MTYEETDAFGCKVEIGDGASPEVFAELNGLFNGPRGPGIQAETKEARHHGSRKVIIKQSFYKDGAITFSLYYDSSDTEHRRLVANAEAGTVTNFKITRADNGAEICTQPCVISCDFDSSEGGFNTCDVTLQPVDGGVVRS